ncbi:hypothetical protein M405DRAFT_745137, partial [Rhizopogon salebrosus TDB-379]
WRSFNIEEIGDIKFDDNAWHHLVIDEDLCRTCDVTTNANILHHIISDVITGEGNSPIAALYGPPGTGKTLTVEAVDIPFDRALVHVPISVHLSHGALPARYSIVLIDEADVFLGHRSLHEWERNRLISVALKVLEYHRGVLFLTTTLSELRRHWHSRRQYYCVFASLLLMA